jgi:hypothetical protein
MRTQLASIVEAAQRQPEQSCYETNAMVQAKSMNNQVRSSNEKAWTMPRDCVSRHQFKTMAVPQGISTEQLEGQARDYQLHSRPIQLDANRHQPDIAPRVRISKLHRPSDNKK